MEEDLLPPRDGPGPVVGEGHATLRQAALDPLDVVRPERDVAALERVDGLSGAERHVQIEGGEMHLARAVGQEANTIRDLIIRGLGQLEHVLVEVL